MFFRKKHTFQKKCTRCSGKGHLGNVKTCPVCGGLGVVFYKGYA